MIFNLRRPKVVFVLALFVAVSTTYFCLKSLNSGTPILSPLSSTKSYFDYQAPKEQFRLELEDHPDYKTTGLNFKPKYPSSLLYNTTVLEQLNYLFPYDASQPLPKQIWQMWKVGLDHEEFPDDFKKFHQTWVDNSPEYDHLLKTNAECDELVGELYGNVPDIIHAYNAMPYTILKCDFSRYLLLFAYGGIYTDIDTILLKPISEWISSESQYLNKSLDIGLIVGLESDRAYNWQRWAARRVQINSWTFMVKRGHPMLAELINKITEDTLWRESTGQLNATLGRDHGDNVNNWTGPGRFTDFVFKHMNNLLQTDFRKYDTLVKWPFLDKVELPIAVGDTMILPKKSMSPSWKLAKSGDPLVYVKHISRGVWKKGH